MHPFVDKDHRHPRRLRDGPFAGWIAPEFDGLGRVRLATLEGGLRNIVVGIARLAGEKIGAIGNPNP